MNKILVVDDDEGVRMLYADELMDEGYDVVTCGEGSRVMDFIQEERPDLVLMDLKLGNYDGVDLVRDIRKAFDRLPVILCTAHSSIGRDLKSIGAAGYVLKSSDLSDLKVKIRKALDGRKNPIPSAGRPRREGGRTIPIKPAAPLWKDARWQGDLTLFSKELK